MGTKYYSTYFQNELEKIEKNIKETIIDPRIITLKQCEKQVPKGNNCNNPKKMTDELALINDDSLKKFNEQINVLLTKFNNDIVTKKVTSQTVFLQNIFLKAQFIPILKIGN